LAADLALLTSSPAILPAPVRWLHVVGRRRRALFFKDTVSSSRYRTRVIFSEATIFADDDCDVYHVAAHVVVVVAARHGLVFF
jgi:hypothetical protein